MENIKLRNGAIGAVVGFAIGEVGGRFLKPQYAHHIGFICAALGFVVGYNQGGSMSAAPVAAAAVTPAATA